MASASTSVAAALTALSGCDFLSSADVSAEQTAALLQLATQLKHGDRRIDLGNRQALDLAADDFAPRRGLPLGGQDAERNDQNDLTYLLSKQRFHQVEELVMLIQAKDKCS